MKKTIFLIVILFVAFGCSEVDFSEEESIPVTISVVEPSVISETVIAPCRLEAGNEAIVSVSKTAVVEQILVTSGDTVFAGQRLLSLKTDDMQRAIISDATALLTAARASSEFASSNLNRAEELLETGSISVEEFDRIQTEATASDATLSRAIAGYNISLTSAQSSFVQAPFDGIVGRIYVSEGNTASGALMSIASAEVLIAELLVAPEHIHKLQIGLPVIFTTSHFPGAVFPGAVVSVSDIADPISGLVSLTVQFSDSTASLIPGLSGRTMILVSTKENSISIPTTMMTLVENDLWEVFVLENGIPRKRHIVTGIRSGSRYEIIEGLVFGDSLIDLGHTLVSDGCSVRVVL